MSKEILFRISHPADLFKEEQVFAVIIPAAKGDITILPERAPTMFLLQNGMVQVLNNQFAPIERYFVKGGMAEVAANKCSISAEKVFSVDSIDIPQAEQQRDAAPNEEEKAFYQMVVGKLQQLQRSK